MKEQQLLKSQLDNVCIDCCEVIMVKGIVECEDCAIRILKGLAISNCSCKYLYQ